MTPRMDALPLEGGGLGGGVGDRPAAEARETSPETHAAPAAPTPIPDPSPLEGEGRRYRRGHLYTANAARSAKRMRREPTLGERKLWAALRKLDLHVRRQVPLGPYIADFAVLSSKLVIEVDGASHSSPQAEEHDALRDAFLCSQGFRVLRFTDADVLADVERVAEQVAAAASLSRPVF